MQSTAAKEAHASLLLGQAIKLWLAAAIVALAAMVLASGIGPRADSPSNIPARVEQVEDSGGTTHILLPGKPY